MRRALLATSALAWLLTTAGPAAAEPVSITILGTVITINVAAIAASAFVSLALAGLSLLLAPDVPEPDPRNKLNGVSSLAPYRVSYSYQRIGGDVIFREVAPGTDRLYMCVLLSSIPSEGEFQLYVDGRPCPVDAAGDAYDFTTVRGDSDAPIFAATAGADGELNGRGYVWFDRGDQTTVPAAFSTDLATGGGDGEIPSDFASFWQGRTKVYVIFDFGNPKNAQKYWRAIPPVVSVLGKFAKVYDPREAAHDADDPTTWEYSANHALVTLDALRRIEVADPRNGLLPMAKIDAASFIAGADVCDEAVALKGGGTEPRYTCAGIITLNGESTDIITPLLRAGAAGLTMVSGVWRYVAGETVSSTVTLTDDDLVGDQIEVRYVRPPEESFNTVRARFRSPDRNWEMAEAPDRTDAAFIAADGGDENILTIDLPWVTSKTQIQRIQKRMLLQARLERTITAEWAAPAYAAHAECGVTVDFDQSLPSASGFYVASSWSPQFVEAEGDALELRVSMLLIEASADVDAWDETVDEYDFDAATAPGNGGLEIAAPAIFSVVADSTTAVAGDSGMIGLARVSITPSASPSVYGYEVEARKSNGASPPAYSEWRPSKTADAESVDGSGRIIVDVSPLDVGGVYQFRVRADGPGSMSDWVGSGDVSISTDSDAPSSPTGVTASGGVGEITVNIVMPTEPDANRWRIYSGASSSFGSASLDDTRYELPGRADVHTVTAPAGTRYVWVTALDRSGNESAEQASTPASVTVT